jgi:transglutaminase-like putative cysteine protease
MRNLETSEFLDHDAPAVRDFVSDAVGATTDDRERAVRIFEKVRDGIRYDPYVDIVSREQYKASVIAGTSANFCVPKAVLLTAAWRAAGFPSRLGFADVRNHLNSAKLRARMSSDVFVWHGYSEILIDGRWQKVSSAFNIELCRRFGVKVLDWHADGDALMHPYDEAGNQHMEYVRSHGSFDDVPYDRLMAAYGRAGATRADEPVHDNAFHS